MTRLLQITLYQEESPRTPPFIWKYCNRHDWVRRYKHGLCTECCTLLKCTRVTCRLGKLLVLFWWCSQYAASKHVEGVVAPVWRFHLELLLRYGAVLKAGEPQQGREGRQQHRASQLCQQPGCQGWDREL